MKIKQIHVKLSDKNILNFKVTNYDEAVRTLFNQLIQEENKQYSKYFIYVMPTSYGRPAAMSIEDMNDKDELDISEERQHPQEFEDKSCYFEITTSNNVHLQLIINADEELLGIRTLELDIRGGLEKYRDTVEIEFENTNNQINTLNIEDFLLLNKMAHDENTGETYHQKVSDKSLFCIIDYSLLASNIKEENKLISIELSEEDEN